jgi:hypothetical protein
VRESLIAGSVRMRRPISDFALDDFIFCWPLPAPRVKKGMGGIDRIACWPWQRSQPITYGHAMNR